MPSDLLMPSDVAPAPAGTGRGLRWFFFPAAVAVTLVGLFMLLSHILNRTTPIETELAAAMKSGMTVQQRIELSGRVVEMLERPARAQPDATLLLLSLGRIWQGSDDHSTGIATARQRAKRCLVGQLASADVPRRKAAVLAFAFWKATPETASVTPRLIEMLNDAREDPDVRIAAAAALGAIATPSDQNVIAALEQARNLADERQVELTWNAALSLARLGQTSATGTLLKLLDRRELAQLKIYDREADPRNPRPRQLNDFEIERFLVNVIEAASGLPDAAVTARIRELSKSDPSARVRAAAEIAQRP